MMRTWHQRGKTFRYQGPEHICSRPDRPQLWVTWTGSWGPPSVESPQTGPWVFDEKETSSQIGLGPDQQQSLTIPAGSRMDIATNMQLKPNQI